MKKQTNLLLEYIQYIKGHKNSKDELAPWVIKSHETNKILSSHKTREEAKEHLRHMHIFGEDSVDNGKSFSDKLIQKWVEKYLESLDSIYEYSFKCSDENDADYLQEIVHFDITADNDYSIQDEYLNSGIIKILSEEEFKKMTGNINLKKICNYPIDFFAINTELDILFAYCSENDIHYFF